MDEDVLVAMIVCGFYLRDVPMGFREKVLMCMLIIKWMNMYIQTEADIIWVNKRLDEMSRDLPSSLQESENQFLEPIEECDEL